MKLEKVNNQSMVVNYKKTENVLEDVCSIINSAKNYAYQSVNIALIQRNWLIGYRIAEEELKEKDRADYGLEVIKNLSKELTRIYGKGFTKTNLYKLKIFLNFKQYIDMNEHLKSK